MPLFFFFAFYLFIQVLPLSLSLTLFLTHTHTHTHTYFFGCLLFQVLYEVPGVFRDEQCNLRTEQVGL